MWRLILWNGLTGERLAAPEYDAYLVRWSPDGKWLLSPDDAAVGGRLSLLDSQGQLVIKYAATSLNSIWIDYGFSADSKQVLLGTANGIWQQLDRETGIAQASRARGINAGGSLSPVGRHVLVKGSLLLDLEKEQQVARLMPLRPGLGLIVSPAGNHRGNGVNDVLYVVQLPDRQLLLNSDEFGAQFGWKNSNEVTPLK